jgi:hypothetical protein
VNSSFYDFILLLSLAIVGILTMIYGAKFRIEFWGWFFDGDDDSSDILSLEQKQTEELGKKIYQFLKEDLPTSEISMALPLPNSEDIIVMMKYVANFRNVFRCKPDGSILWQAELPTKADDVYTNIKWRDGKLTAYSRSCISVQLDVETGKIMSSTNSA